MGNFLCWVEAHPGLASWIQAGGSLLAVLAALFVVLLQHHLEKKRMLQKERKSQRDFLKAVNTIADLGRMTMEDAIKIGWSNVDFPTDITRTDTFLMLNHVSEMLKEIPVWNHPLQYLPISISILKRNIDRFINSYSSSSPDDLDIHYSNLSGGTTDKLYQEIKTVCDRIKYEFEQAEILLKKTSN